MSVLPNALKSTLVFFLVRVMQSIAICWIDGAARLSRVMMSITPISAKNRYLFLPM